jgi:FKBP-type peptidyl-prolyl cis-trans isomerase FkpA
MKARYKVSILATAMALVMQSPYSLAAKTASTEPAAAPAETVTLVKGFKDKNHQVAYALGASLGNYMENSLKAQEKLGIKLDNKEMIAGVADALNNKNKLTEEQIGQTLKAYQQKLQSLDQAHRAKEAKENQAKGEAFAANFAKEAGVVKTDSGLLYKIENEGTGAAPVNSDTVSVNYIGKLVDGKQFDSSYERKEPTEFRLDSVIPGWTEGLKHIKKGGKIKLVIPASLAYGENGIPGAIPPNSTLVFDVELVDIKPAVKETATDAKAAPEISTMEVKNPQQAAEEKQASEANKQAPAAK